MDNCWNTHFGCSVHYRSGNISSSTDNDIWLKITEDFFCLTDTLKKQSDCLDIIHGNFSFKALNLQSMERHSCIRDNFIFQTTFCSHIHEFSIRFLSLHIIDKGKSRINMSSRSSACNQNFHFLSLASTFSILIGSQLP